VETSNFERRSREEKGGEKDQVLGGRQPNSRRVAENSYWQEKRGKRITQKTAQKLLREITEMGKTRNEEGRGNSYCTRHETGRVTRWHVQSEKLIPQKNLVRKVNEEQRIEFLRGRKNPKTDIITQEKNTFKGGERRVGREEWEECLLGWGHREGETPFWEGELGYSKKRSISSKGRRSRVDNYHGKKETLVISERGRKARELTRKKKGKRGSGLREEDSLREGKEKGGKRQTKTEE